MHELGVLREIVKTVSKVMENNNIKSLSYITLEVGFDSGFVPYYLTKLFPIAADSYPQFVKTVLNISTVPGKGLVIKEIAY